VEALAFPTDRQVTDGCLLGRCTVYARRENLKYYQANESPVMGCYIQIAWFQCVLLCCIVVPKVQRRDVNRFASVSSKDRLQIDYIVQYNKLIASHCAVQQAYNVTLCSTTSL
jgi:hypothetical protein